ncbi:hypothetical protein roselon_00164 [Roseibacterium elongatum DSM 19469]|uniref:Uncharacterized protein n=1 Tax=Roseicyclus elongatus DSM 19469 TaxID=1294273 RepID=W8S1L3_9RHOB|nr:hypothetical protein roselon_00164 [Roseibacterium elongatum DSM 19469]
MRPIGPASCAGVGEWSAWLPVAPRGTPRAAREVRARHRRKRVGSQTAP